MKIELLHWKGCERQRIGGLAWGRSKTTGELKWQVPVHELQFVED